ncbi:MBL fold metallo-hydrolase [Sciscionella sediminilitoris]|uniref:MBL fold metallo-hydrolase n=1 Tax=Sciscionella sediminilitoris TaxID=1445613 RepID=UPI00068C0CF2|nr:MBL fold metallo-hydrolase [Sciscionella sp. SE31]
MRLRRLAWAGAELEHEGHTLVIDLIGNGDPMFSTREIPLSRPGATAAALVTHLHSDHADPVAARVALAEGAPVFRPEPFPGSAEDNRWTDGVERAFREQLPEAEVLRPWQQRSVGPFRVMAVPAVDGLGDPQLSWVVDCAGVRIFHGGDTIFHGYWWLIARRFGPIDTAFVPINGPVVELDHLQPPSPFNAVMLPEQAAEAAHILGAATAVPMHYGLHRPGAYEETPDAVPRFQRRARELGIVPNLAQPGEWFSR